MKKEILRIHYRINPQRPQKMKATDTMMKNTTLKFRAKRKSKKMILRQIKPRNQKISFLTSKDHHL